MNRIVSVVALATILACARGESPDARGTGRADWTTSVDTVGDTIVVRTTGGSAAASAQRLIAEVSIGDSEGADEYTFGAINEVEVAPSGTIYLFDRQVPALRAYDSAGKYIRTIGRKGGGPGEYQAANGVAVHRDGRIVLWDPGKASVNVYDVSGEPLTTWPVPGTGGYYTTSAVFVDTAGNTYLRKTIADPPKTPNTPQASVFGTQGLVKWNAAGEVVDSLAPPASTVEPAFLLAQNKGSTSRSSVPFATSFIWTFSPLGYFVSARTDRYGVTLGQVDGRIMRIERDAKAIPVDGDERAGAEELATANMRRVDPGWKWSGPSIPSTKPFVRGLAVGDDGRIWVTVATPGERVPEGERAPSPSVQVGSVPPRPEPRWREPLIYDVFEPTGRFLGTVAAPPRTSFRAMRGDHVWGVTRDSLDVEQVVRYRLAPGFANPPR